MAHADLDAAIAYRPAPADARGAQADGGAERIDVRTFLADVGRLRAALPPNRHVLNVCGDRYRFMVGLAAAMCADKISLLPSTHTPESVRQMQAFAADVFCLADAEVGIDLPTLRYPDAAPDGAGIATADAEAGSGAAIPPVIPTLPADRVVAYVFTSGSTGTPVAHAKRWGALVGSVRAAARRLDIGVACTLIGTVPPQHMYGFESTVLLALQGGAAIWSGKPFYAADIAAALAAVPAPRVLVSTPFHLRTFVEAQLPSPPLRMVISATAPLTPELGSAIERYCAAPLLEIYGCTESGQIATRRPLADDAWQLLDGARMRQLHADDGIDSGHDDRGMQSAARDGTPPVATDESAMTTFVEGDFIDGSIPLGDIIALVDAQRFRLLGRSADLINIVGKRTSLGFLNQQLLAIPGVRDGCFFLPDGPDGKAGDDSDKAIARLAAFAVTDALGAADIVRALRQRIDPVFLPRPLLVVEQLPRNAAGKLPRAALQALLDRHGPAARPDAIARTAEQRPAADRQQGTPAEAAANGDAAPPMHDKYPASIEHAVALRVDPQHPAFAGHFPGRPIVPGVLLIDWALAALHDAYPDIGLPGELGTVKFLQPVGPDAELHIALRVDRRADKTVAALRIEQAGTLVASATLSSGAGLPADAAPPVLSPSSPHSATRAPGGDATHENTHASADTRSDHHLGTDAAPQHAAAEHSAESHPEHGTDTPR